VVLYERGLQITAVEVILFNRALNWKMDEHYIYE